MSVDNKVGLYGSSARDKSKVQTQYILYGSTASYFTQKIYAAMKWYFTNNFIYKPKNLTNKQYLETRSETHQIPVVITPENWCIADSTPILHLLDSRLDKQRFYPQGLVGLLTHILEEYFDEWATRWCIYSRWLADKATAEEAAYRLASEQILSDQHEQNKAKEKEEIDNAVKMAAEMIRNWGGRAGRSLGITSPVQHELIEREMFKIYEAMDKHFTNNKFVFGKLPTAVDTIILGGLRAHFLYDIYPRDKILNKFPNVQKFLKDFEDFEGFSREELQSGLTLDANNLPDFIKLMLTESGHNFKNFQLYLKEAYENHEKAFTIDVFGEPVSFLVRPYVEKSRRMLENNLHVHLANCSEREQHAFRDILKTYGLSDVYNISGFNQSTPSHL